MNFLRVYTTWCPSLCLQGLRIGPKIVSSPKQTLSNVCRIYLAEIMAMALSITKDFLSHLDERKGRRTAV